MGDGPDKRLIELFASPEVKDSGAIFFFFKESGELVLEGRAGATDEAQEFLRDVLFLIDSWMSEDKQTDD
jgi:hypothetical protein